MKIKDLQIETMAKMKEKPDGIYNITCCKLPNNGSITFFVPYFQHSGNQFFIQYRNKVYEISEKTINIIIEHFNLFNEEQSKWQ